MAAEKNRLYRSYLERMGPEALALGQSMCSALCGRTAENRHRLLQQKRPLILNEPDWTDSLTRWQMAVRLPSRNLIRVFRLAARKLRLSPDECAVVEDASAESWPQMQAAFSIGLGTPPRPRLCRAVLNALYELPELCRRLYSRAPRVKPSDPTPFS